MNGSIAGENGNAEKLINGLHSILREDVPSLEQIAQIVSVHGKYVGLVRLSDCYAVASKNPRKFVDLEMRNQMLSDIRERGIDQSIMFNLRPEGLEVTAGYTRFGIAKELGMVAIPAVVKIYSDEEASHVAAAENLFRANLSPVEEGLYASRRLMELKNDMDELVRELRWSPSKIKSRLAITKVIDKAQEALVNRKIMIGHVELLVSLSPDAQAGFLDVIINDGLSVEEARLRLEAKQTPLITACFDTVGCSGCQHNTAVYRELDLFDSSSISKGAYCRNSKCFKEKTKIAIEKIVEEQRQEYGTARMDVEIANDSTVVLVANGINGVGEEQLRDCANCVHYGCSVSTQANSIGKVTGPICFDLKCHKDKVEKIRIIEPARGSNSVSATEDNKAPTKSIGAATEKKGSDKSPGNTKALRTHLVNSVTNIVSVNTEKSPSVKRCISIFGLYKNVNQILTDELKRLLKHKDVSSDDGVLKRLLQMTDSELDGVENVLCVLFLSKSKNTTFLEESTEFKYVVSVLHSLEIDVKDYWQVDESYLKLLTRNAIETLLDESGFKAKFSAVKGDSEFKKLLAMKVSELPTKIMEFKEFDWAGYLPRSMDIKRMNGKGK